MGVFSLKEEGLTKLLETLNTNIETLSKITALTFRKETLFEGKKTKQEQIEVLDEMKLPDDVIALIIGSTAGSVQVQRSQRKAKVKKTQETESENTAEVK